MAKFRLNSGVHSEGGQTYSAGATFESDQDLLKLNNGANRFELIGPPDKPKMKKGQNTPLNDAANRNAAAFPHGQVHDGLQKTSGRGDISETGPMSLEEAAAMAGDSEGVQGTEPAGDEEELSQLTLKELHELAEEEKIDLKGATRKDDVIRAIREARDEE